MNDDDINDFRSFFEGGDEHDPDHEPYHFGIAPDTYMELVETILHQTESQVQEFGISTATTLCWAAAQPEAFEKRIDITEEAKFKLGDWTDEDKAKITAIEIRQIFYGCEKRAAGEEGHDDHFIALAQVLRIGTDRGHSDWHWSQVRSDYDFELVLTGICEAYHQEHCRSDHGHEATTIIAGQVRRSRVRTDFQEKFQEAIVRRSVDEFRKELDDLFPSTPEEGGSHAEPGTG